MPIRVSDCLDAVCLYTGLSREDLRSASRERHLAQARAIVYYLARKSTRLGWRAIVRHATGRRWASSAQRMVERLEQRMVEDPHLAHDVLELVHLVGRKGAAA
jgi:chromosomal replication initiation ATPase DnaA